MTCVSDGDLSETQCVGGAQTHDAGCLGLLPCLDSGEWHIVRTRQGACGSAATRLLHSVVCRILTYAREAKQLLLSARASIRCG